MKKKLDPNVIKILLAEDDKEDRFFFEKALSEVPKEVNLKVVQNGEKLLTYLHKNEKNLPHVLFLDLNMPLKNGSECLAEINANQNLKHVPIIIYSTSLHDAVADVLYDSGAYYYVRKTNFYGLKKILNRIFMLIECGGLIRPTREEFVFTLPKV